MFRRAVASDASEYAGGVVSTPLTDSLHLRYWPICSSRHHAIMQTTLNVDSKRESLLSGSVDTGSSSLLRPVLHAYYSFYVDLSAF
jgi:hypothetical protein